MDTKVHSERLFALIQRFGSESQEARQVARRLGELLPLRFYELKRNHSRYTQGAASERAAFTDEQYLAFIEEYCEVTHKGLMSRIQYDTHLMLLKARQTNRINPARNRSFRKD